MTELSSVRSFDLTVSLEFDSDLPVSLLSNPQFNCGVLQTLSRESATPLAPFSWWRQSKRARGNLEGPPVEAVPESIRRGPTP